MRLITSDRFSWRLAQLGPERHHRLGPVQQHQVRHIVVRGDRVKPTRRSAVTIQWPETGRDVVMEEIFVPASGMAMERTSCSPSALSSL